jgi:nucleotide-binding universal stress UspA family protein
MQPQILVPLDGSALAEGVLPYAVALARLSASTLVLLQVIPSRIALPSIGWRAFERRDIQQAWAEAVTAARASLEQTADRLRADGLTVQTVVCIGDPASEILTSVTRTPGIRFIAMSTHGRTGLQRAVFGSVAEAVLHTAPVPVLLVRTHVDARPAAQTIAYTTILVPLDVDAFAEPALEQACHLAAASGATLVLLTAVPDRDDLARATEGMVSFAALGELQAVADRMMVELAAQAQRLEASGLHVRTMLARGWPAEAILRAAAQEHADLIVMATHGRGGLQRLRLGSVALQVVQAAVVPVLLVRRSERAQEAAVRAIEPTEIESADMA